MDEVCIPDTRRILSFSNQTIDLFSTWCEDLEVHLNSKYSGFPNDKIIQIIKRLTDYKPNPVFPMINRLFHLLTETILRVVEHEEKTATPINRHLGQNQKQKIQKLVSKDRNIKPISSFNEEAVIQFDREIKDLKKVLKQHRQIFHEIQKQQEVCWVAKSKITKYELCLATANSSRSHLSDKLPEKELKSRDKAIDHLRNILDEKVNFVAEASQKYARLLDVENSTRLKMKQMESKLLADMKFGITERLYCGLSSLKQILSTKSDQRTNKLLSEVLDIESSMSSLASSIIDTFSSKYKHCNPQMQHEHKLALTKNYTLLVNETPVDAILKDLVRQEILTKEQQTFIAGHATTKGRTRALLEVLPGIGPKAFHGFCYALLAHKKNDLVSVLTNPETEDMEVCFPEFSSFNLGGNVHLTVEPGVITLKQGGMDMCFPLIRWRQLEYLLDDIDEAVNLLSNNRYASLKQHIGGNVYVCAESPGLTIDIRHYWLSPLDFTRHPTPQGITLDFEQFDKLVDVDKVLPTLVPELTDMIPCLFSHQNIEGALWCGECHPNGPDF